MDGVSPISGFLCSVVQQKKIFCPECPWCGNGPYIRKPKDHGFCSEECRKRMRQRNAHSRNERKREKKKTYGAKKRKQKAARQKINRAKRALDTTPRYVPYLVKKYGATFYTTETWVKVRYEALRRSNKCCALCGSGASKGSPLHVDHIKPRSRYPELALSLENLQVLCGPCNMGKSNEDETDWRTK